MTTAVNPERTSRRTPERQPVIDQETWAAIDYLIRRRRDVRMVSGCVWVDGMAMTAAHVQGLARQRGWEG